MSDITEYKAFSLSDISLGTERKFRDTVLSLYNTDPDTLEGDGYFTGYASTFTTTPDSYGDIVARGAFDNTLEEWAKSPNALPILYNHNESDPFYNIGEVIEIATDEHGLKVLGRIDLESGNKVAEQVYRLIKARRVKEMSFMYFTREYTQLAGDVRRLDDVELLECSIVFTGANREALVTSVKNTIEMLKKSGEDVGDELKEISDLCSECSLKSDEKDETSKPVDSEDTDETSDSDGDGTQEHTCTCGVNHHEENTEEVNNITDETESDNIDTRAVSAKLADLATRHKIEALLQGA